MLRYLKNSTQCAGKERQKIMAIEVLGTGFYVPENVVTNDDISEMVDTSDEWIMQRVGVHSRHISVDETAADFATNAAMEALKAANITPEDLDLIVAATITSETICPSLAGTVQKNIGALCPAFDINSACSGFLFALDTAVSYIARGKIRNVLVIGAERLSKIVDWSDRSTCVIFGDGAGAFVIAPGENYLSSTLYTMGGNDVLEVPNFTGASPFYKAENRDPYIMMEGQETFKFAVNKIVEDIKYVAEDAGISLDEIDHIVTHQANIRIIDYASKRLGIPKEKFFVNIERYGNTSAASVPIAVAELNRTGKIKKGDIVVLAAFGGGLSSAACIIKW